ncbi:MAG TPA: nicotinamide-nucleotide amidohydrolase family protein [Acidiferrobacterales bacterium]
MAVDDELIRAAEQLGRMLKAAGEMLATAESCTGGWVAETLTALPGSSHWFERGFVTYSNVAKHEMLGIGNDVLLRYGAVSEPVARAMAEGALARSHADLALAVTGIAGPGGGSVEKPVGTVCFAWAARGRPTRSSTLRFDGDRVAVRRQSVQWALLGMVDYLRAPT